MILQPTSASELNDSVNNRIIYSLQYKWVNGVSQTDLSDTVSGLRKVNDITVIQFTNVVNGVEGSDGFTIQYVHSEDATASEKLLQITTAISGFVNSIVQGVKTVAQYSYDTGFNLGTDLRGFIDTYGSYLIIFIILGVVLYVYTHRRG